MDEILLNVSSYYSEKIKKFGATSRGVDWNGFESQFLRFSVLSKVILENNFSLLDYGCGYGAYIDFLNIEFINRYSFVGYDISEEMIKCAKEKYPKNKFIYQSNLLETSDYVVSSGIFNVKNNINKQDWKEYIFREIDEMNRLSEKGFSFNALTKYSDKEYMKSYLHYSDPLEIFDYCKRNFSKNVTLLHDYDLYEFTIIVRK